MSHAGDDPFSPGPSTTAGSLSYPANPINQSQPITSNHNSNSARNSFRAPSTRASRRAGQASSSAIFPADANSSISNGSIKENSTITKSTFSDPVEEYRLKVKRILDDRTKQYVAIGGLGIEISNQKDELEGMVRDLEALRASSHDPEQDRENASGNVVDAARLKGLEEKLKEFELKSSRLFTEVEKSSGKKTRTAMHGSDLEGLPTSALYPIPGASGLRAPLNPLSSTSDNLPTSSSTDGYPSILPSNHSNSSAEIQQLTREAQLSRGVCDAMVLEIRRLQILVEERDGQILIGKGEKAELEKRLEPLVQQKGGLEAENQRLADDIWNADIRAQRAEDANAELQKRVERTDAEIKRLSATLSSSRLELETHKNESDRLASVIEKLRSDHQTDLARLKGEVQQKQIQNEQLQTELEKAKKVINDGNARGYSASPSPSLGSPASSTPASQRTINRQMDAEDPFMTQQTPGLGLNASYSYDSPGGQSFDGPDAEDSPAGRSIGSANHPTLADHLRRDETVRDLQSQLASAQADLARLRGNPAKESMSPYSDMSDSPSLRRSGLPQDRTSARMVMRGGIRPRKSSGMMRASASPSALGKSVFNNEDEDRNVGSPSTPARPVTLASDLDNLDPSYGATPGSGSSSSSDARSRRSDTDSPLQPMSNRSHAPRLSSALRNMSSPGIPGSPASPHDLGSDLVGHSRFADEDEDDEEGEESAAASASNVSLSPEQSGRTAYVCAEVGAAEDEEEGESTTTPTVDCFPSIPSSATLTAINMTPPRPTSAMTHVTEMTPVANRLSFDGARESSASPSENRPPSPSFTDNMTTDNEGETDYEDARTTGTMTPVRRSPRGTESPYETANSDADDFRSFGQQSSADNDSDAESIRASARPRPTGAKRSMPPSITPAIIEKTVYRDVPADAVHDILLAVFASREIVRAIPAIKTEVRYIDVERIVEVPVEKLVYQEMPIDTMRMALMSVLAGKEVVKGIPAIKTEIRDVVVEKLVEVPVEKLVYQEMPPETLRGALLAVLSDKEVVRGIPAIKVEYREVIVEKIVEVPIERIVYQEMPAAVLQHALNSMFRNREIVRGIPAVKTVIQDKIVEKLVELPVIRTQVQWNDVPHDQLQDIFANVFKSKEVVRDNVIVRPPVVQTVEVIRDIPQDTLRNIFTSIFAGREIAKQVHTHTVIRRDVEVPVYRDVPHDVLREVFANFASSRQISRPIHTHSVSVREVEVPKDVVREVEVIKEIPTPYEVIKEVEVIVYVDRPVDVIKEIPTPYEVIKEVEVIKYVDVIKQIPAPYEVVKEVEVIKFVDKPVEVIKEVPTPYETIKEVEVIKYVDKLVEVFKEVPTPFETIKEVEVIKEVPTPFEVIREVEVIRYVDKPIEVIKEVTRDVEVIREVQVPFETIREVEKIVDREVPVPVEVVKEIIKEVKVPVDVIREVERIVHVEVQVPFETIREVEKVVEVPVEVIREVERTVERIVEVPVEVIREVEKIVYREVAVPFETVREVSVEKLVEVPVEVVREVERIVEVPVEVIREVERIIEVPVDVIREVEKIVERIVEVPVETIREIEKVIDREVRVPFETIREVERIVIREVEVPVEVIREVEKLVEVPVPHEVIKEVEKIVQVPFEVVRTVEVPVEREVYRDTIVPVQIHRLEQKNAQTQTDVHATQMTPDLALYRVNSGGSYDFLKGPPSESTSSKRISAALARRQSKASGRALDRSALATGSPTGNIGPVDDHDESSSDNAESPILTVPPPPDMPPPSTLPVKRMTAIVPPRPQSPPPARFAQRSVTPSSPFLTPAPPAHRRTNSASTPVETSGLRKPSTNSFRSAANVADGLDGPTGSTSRYHTISSSAVQQSREAVRRRADVVINSEPRSRQTSDNRSLAPSFATSVRSSDLGLPHQRHDWEAASTGDGIAGGSSDPAVIQAITQTMIGEFLWKSTRKAFGSALSDNKHQRFFWIHPYTRTLYWSPVDPGHEKTNESKAKSIFITNIRVQNDPGHDEDRDTWRQSLIVSAASRDIRITAPSRERHLAWVTALTYLVARPSQSTMSGRTTLVPVPSASLTTPARRGGDLVGPENIDDFGIASTSGRRMTGSASLRSYKSQTATPKGQPPRSQSALSGRRRSSAKSVGRQASTSVSGKRPGTAAHEYMMQSDPEWRDSRAGGGPVRSHMPAMSVHSGRRSMRSMGRIQSGIETDFDRVERAEAEDEGSDRYEGLDNVRACCEGEHDLGALSHTHHSHRRPAHDRRTSSNSGRTAEHTVLGEIQPRSPSGRTFSFLSTERQSFASQDLTPTHAHTIGGKGKQPIRRVASQALGGANNENAGSTPIASGKQSIRRKTAARKPSIIGGAH